MQITVHRGLNQIGGCITEISTEHSRIFVDMGDNLPGQAEQLTELQKQQLVGDLFRANKRQHEAVFYTHGHSDHVGMLQYVPETVEQYMSQGTKDLLLIKEEVLSEGVLLSKPEAMEDGVVNDAAKEEWQRKLTWMEERFRRLQGCKTWIRTPGRYRPVSLHVGDITVTPFFVSHSIFDAYMLLIEADGKRILHTGDYRAHGYFGKGLFPTLRGRIGQVDILITEGAMLRCNTREASEAVVSRRMQAMMEGFKYVFVLTSATDIERLMAVNRAAKDSKRLLVTCSMLMDKTLKYFNDFGREWTGKEFGFDYYLLSMSKPATKLVQFMKRKGFVMLVGAGHCKRVEEILQNFKQEEVLLIYSTWDGYYRIPLHMELAPGYRQMRDLFRNVVDIHTSGHADMPTIEKVIKTVNPREAIIGIHKEADTSLCSLHLPEELKNKILPENMQLDYVSLK